MIMEISIVVISILIAWGIDHFQLMGEIQSLVALSQKIIFLFVGEFPSDHWKEKVLIVYAIKLFKLSFFLLTKLFAIFFVYALLYFAMQFFFLHYIKWDELSNWHTLILSALGFFFYFIYKKNVEQNK